MLLRPPARKNISPMTVVAAAAIDVDEPVSGNGVSHHGRCLLDVVALLLHKFTNVGKRFST